MKKKEIKTDMCAFQPSPLNTPHLVMFYSLAHYCYDRICSHRNYWKINFSQQYQIHWFFFLVNTLNKLRKNKTKTKQQVNENEKMN